MASTTEDVALTESEIIDEEILNLKQEAAALRKALKVECSTILSAPSTSNMLRSSSSRSSSTTLLRKPVAATESPQEKLLSRSVQQNAYMQQCLYRIATSVTSFKVHDPDPNAVDGGHVLGLRFEIMSKGQFLKPYYVMLNRPFADSKHLRVHRHTIPPAIPLSGLAARHLPSPKPESDSTSPPQQQQDLDRFVRVLRREITRYHNRLGVSADLRRALGLHNLGDPEDLASNNIVDVGIADIEAKQIRLTWADERSGRLVMDDDGKVKKLMIFGTDGRDWETTKELFGNYQRIEDFAQKLEAYASG